MMQLGKRSKAIWTTLQAVFYTVLLILVLGPIILAIVWLTPLLMIVGIGILLFLTFKLLLTEVDDPESEIRSEDIDDND